MGSIRPLPPQEILNPEDIRVAVSAFEAALQSLHGEVEEQAARETLARYIMHHALLGERDPIQLRDAALAHLAEPKAE